MARPKILTGRNLEAFERARDLKLVDLALNLLKDLGHGDASRIQVKLNPNIQALFVDVLIEQGYSLEESKSAYNSL